MAYRIHTEATLLGVTAEDVYATWSDLPATPTWDPRDDLNEMDGPFAAGTTGRFAQGSRTGTYEILSVGPGLEWCSSTALPGGALVVEHTVTATPEGVCVVKDYLPSGPLVLAFRAYFARQIKDEMPATFAALAAETRRRVTVA